MRGKNLKSISFSLILGPDGLWRNSLHKSGYHSRLDAWRAGMVVVRHKLDQLQSVGAGKASGRRLASYPA